MCDVEELKLRVICKTLNEPDYMFIVWKKKGQIGICKSCWAKIGDKNWECGKDPRPNMKDLLSDRARFGENPIETVYKPKEKELKTRLTEDDEYE